MMSKKLLLISVLVALSLSVQAQNRLYANTFSLSDVELLEGPFKHARDLNGQVLLQYNMDRLLAPFLKEAGLTPKEACFPNWEGLDGHMGGHYLSALALHYASTGSQACYDRMKYMLAELKRCQDANGDGYIGGVPNSHQLWGEVKKGNFTLLRRTWCPWYNVHKIFAGLRDAWLYGGIEEARDMFLKLCDWGLDITGGLSEEVMEEMLAIEFGGMNEVFADAYQMTGDAKYLAGAKRFAHHLIFDSMRDHLDNLDNKHANTQVPKAVGYARIARLGDDADFRRAAEFFWDRVANHRSVVIGGNSCNERFLAANDYISYVERREGPETCNTYNMLKLTEFLFSIDPRAAYADFYEKALFNHILSTQHPEHGGYVYFTSMRPSHYRVYSAPNSAMWCCAGTGMENHSKYGEFIYTHDGTQELRVNLFVASRLHWKENRLTLTQETDFPYAESVKLSVLADKPKKFRMLIRIPEWVEMSGFAVKVNGKSVSTNRAQVSSYFEIERKWKDGDIVEVALPMRSRVVELDHAAEYLAVTHGPIVLAARTSSEGLDGLIADDGRWGHVANGPLVPIDETPIMVGSRKDIDARIQKMKPVVGRPLHYTVAGLFNDPKYDTLELEPFFSLHDSRYAIYFLSLSENDYKDRVDRLRQEQEATLTLDRRTVDKVSPGEQQPEADHRLQSENTTSGVQDNNPYRFLSDGGFFSYEMDTQGHSDLQLSVGYWGAETGQDRSLSIEIDGEPLVTETDFPATNKTRIERKEYEIPEAMLRDKKRITVRFQGGQGPSARVFDVRLLKAE